VKHGLRGATFWVSPTLTASTAITRFYFASKVRCQTGLWILMVDAWVAGGVPMEAVPLLAKIAGK